MSEDIPIEVREFIRKFITSVSLLEVLLTLKGSPQRVWSPEQVSQEMRTNPSYARSQLEYLREQGLAHVVDDKGYRYSPADQGPVIDMLEMIYAHRRSSLISFIYSQPIDSIRDFANAFKIKKD